VRGDAGSLHVAALEPEARQGEEQAQLSPEPRQKEAASHVGEKPWRNTRASVSGRLGGPARVRPPVKFHFIILTRYIRVMVKIVISEVTVTLTFGVPEMWRSWGRTS